MLGLRASRTNVVSQWITSLHPRLPFSLQVDSILQQNTQRISRRPSHVVWSEVGKPTRMFLNDRPIGFADRQFDFHDREGILFLELWPQVLSHDSPAISSAASNTVRPRSQHS